MQRLEICYLGQMPVCVVYIRSNWIRSCGIKGWGCFWASGVIRVLKAIWVVISLKSWPIIYVGLCQPYCSCYFVGNLSLFCYVASLKGALTILAASAFCDWRLGFGVLWGCTNLGVIRKETATVDRIFTFSPNIFCNLLEPCSGSQPWIIWSLWLFLSLFLYFGLSQLSFWFILGGIVCGSDWVSGVIRVLKAIWICWMFVWVGWDGNLCRGSWGVLDICGLGLVLEVGIGGELLRDEIVMEVLGCYIMVLNGQNVVGIWEYVGQRGIMGFLEDGALENFVEKDGMKGFFGCWNALKELETGIKDDEDIERANGKRVDWNRLLEGIMNGRGAGYVWPFVRSLIDRGCGFLG
ncbi:hypothetical protein HanRHA438_Chr12g0558581 [Helianthus annuus]|uniref:Transmembrane protein n=1 Tax=Helianthus annuus TaxID=4232 RepID=A0A9K3MWU9_HELAN|nr:hypothetical protein HanXRQr2_Chr12g0547231 [Helianthus annuus]KAJ0489824.1 hypothetical protein HanHA300_Chr12g0448361 [Helianthus annuus]KAJ0505738.1 hypothetical protein HanHA89_Chr12g0473871 [Helianthus annuus]KAJ0675407.1 hypothetical protein HanLR1_Chr12g0450811 [Helianthus annuus]KAJ0678702.1 hypothetical protein HanOQP8_Chr12g0450871 [Helianthus annuus]